MAEITVCIPTHPARVKNGMTARALGSVLAQTLPASAIIVENDTFKWGAPYTRNLALQKVDTEWVAFLDSDDEFKPHHLETLARAAEEQNADYVWSWYEPVGFGGDPLPHFGKQFDRSNPTQTTITTLVRTSFAQEIGFHKPPEGAMIDGQRYGEDFAFTLACYDAGAKFYHVAERTWNWNFHGMNTSGLPTNGDARWTIHGGRA